MLLFVYGNLRKGFSNHSIIENSPYIGKFRTSQKYMMIVAEPKYYPYLLQENVENAQYASHIIGEVYDVSEYTMKNIDAIENCPHKNIRIRASITNDIDFLFSFIYILGDIDTIADC